MLVMMVGIGVSTGVIEIPCLVRDNIGLFNIENCCCVGV